MTTMCLAFYVHPYKRTLKGDPNLENYPYTEAVVRSWGPNPPWYCSCTPHWRTPGLRDLGLWSSLEKVPG